MKSTIESCSTPNGRVICELISKPNYGSTVYSVHIFEADGDFNYKETHRSYPTGSKRKAISTYKQYKNKYLRNKRV